MTGLPEPVRQLLEAVVDAIDLPLPDLTERDERERALLLDRRALQVSIALATLVKHADTTPLEDLVVDAAQLRKYTSGKPLTYQVFRPHPQDGGAL